MASDETDFCAATGLLTPIGLMAVVEPSPAARPYRVRGRKMSDMSKGTILVIDDEKDLIELVRYNLEKEGYDVIAATDGQSGLDVATQASARPGRAGPDDAGD